MGEIRRIYEQHYWQTWLKIQRERQAELEQRYGIKPEYRSKDFEAKHKRNKDGTFAAMGLTGDEKSIKIADKAYKAIDNILRNEWYIYKDKKKAIITPYDGNYKYLVRINGFRDFDVLQKYKIKPRGGE